jgi:hypothetical protein
MNFLFRRVDGAVPTYADCLSWARFYGLWENNGRLQGYFLTRGEYSLFRRANVWSIDSRGGGSFMDQPFSRSGVLPTFFAPLLPTACAPLVRWLVSPGMGPRGRTYLVGQTSEDTYGNNDTSLLNPLYAVTLYTLFQNLLDGANHGGGWEMGKLVTDVVAGSRVATGWAPYSGVDVPNGIMGTQRRRTRPEVLVA